VRVTVRCEPIETARLPPCLIPYADEYGAVQIANDSPYGTVGRRLVGLRLVGLRTALHPSAVA
jgi:hypothetical protein